MIGSGKLLPHCGIDAIDRMFAHAAMMLQRTHGLAARPAIDVVLEIDGQRMPRIARRVA